MENIEEISSYLSPIKSSSEKSDNTQDTTTEQQNIFPVNNSKFRRKKKIKWLMNNSLKSSNIKNSKLKDSDNNLKSPNKKLYSKIKRNKNVNGKKKSNYLENPLFITEKKFISDEHKIIEWMHAGSCALLFAKDWNKDPRFSVKSELDQESNTGESEHANNQINLIDNDRIFNLPATEETKHYYHNEIEDFKSQEINNVNVKDTMHDKSNAEIEYNFNELHTPKSKITTKLFKDNQINKKIKRNL